MSLVLDECDLHRAFSWLRHQSDKVNHLTWEGQRLGLQTRLACLPVGDTLTSYEGHDPLLRLAKTPTHTLSVVKIAEVRKDNAFGAVGKLRVRRGYALSRIFWE